MKLLFLVAPLLLIQTAFAGVAMDSRLVGTWERVGVISGGQITHTSAKAIFVIDPSGGYQSAVVLPDRVVRLNGTLFVQEGGRATLQLATGLRQDLGMFRFDNGNIVQRPPGSRSEYIYQRQGNTKPTKPKK